MADDWEDGSSTTTSFSGGFGASKGRGLGTWSSNDNSIDEAPRRKGFGRGGFGSTNTDSATTNGFDSGSQSAFGGGRGFGRGGGGFGGSNDSERPAARGVGGSGGGFGNRSGGFGRSGGGFGNGTNDEPQENGGGFGAKKRGGFREGGGGFSGGDDGEDGGGRGGGFSSSSGSRSCGEEGHFARDYPKKGSGGGGGGRGCHNCGEEGHFARDCPNKEPDENRPGPVTYVPPEPSEDDEEIYRTIERGINFDKYDEIPVEVTGKGKEAIIPIQTFQEANLRNLLLENVRKAKYTKPTPVQKYAIPTIIAGRDVMACAQTGSGKTAAFLLPAMSGILNSGLTSSELSGIQTPQGLCISPTRELASQIYNEARKFSKGTMLKPVCIYGGVSVSHQLRQVQRGCNFLVATPGRLKHFVEGGQVSLEKIQYLILDEADRMLDMGFEGDIRKIVETLGMPEKTERQTLMFSATFPEEIQRLAGDFLNDYLFLTVGRVGGTTSDIQQTILDVPEDQKQEKLTELLSCSGTDRTLVFVESKRRADFLASLLSQEGFPTTSIHGDRLQQQREEALRDFREGRCPVLIATNVAARGLDIDDVKHVVNFDLPNEIEEFVHRIGRTGRIGHEGKATTFFQKGKDDRIARALVKILSDASQEVPEWLEEIAESAVGTSYGPAGGRFASRDTRKQFGNSDGWGGVWNSEEANTQTNSQINGTAAWSSAGGTDEEVW